NAFGILIDDVVLPVLNLAEIRFELAGLEQALLHRLLHFLEQMGIAKQRFCWYATTQQTRTAKPRIFFDDRSLQAKLAGTNCCNVTAWTTSDNRNIKRSLF